MPARVAFVLCVESGQLEALTVRAVESLRRHGGRFASAPVLAVTPRRGPGLSRRTREQFRELEIDHLRVNSRRGFGWYHYLNKPVALAAAEARVDTEFVAFLDSDTLVLREPEALDLGEEADFTASVSDIELGGTTGPGHPNEPGWRRICALAGISPDDLPWVQAPLDRVRIRLYFNSGVMAYRRARRVGSLQLELLTRVFDEGIRLPGSASRMVEQVVLSPLVVALSLPWRALPFSHNSTMISGLEYDPKHLREAHVLHYHDSMSPEQWPAFVERIHAEHPDAASWLIELGPLGNPASPLRRAAGESFRVARGLRRRAHTASLALADRLPRRLTDG